MFLKINVMEWVQTNYHITLLLCLAIFILGITTGALITQRITQKQQTAVSENQRQAEAVLRHSEAKFRRFVESNVIGVYVADFNGTIFESNDAFLKMVGYAPDDLQAGSMNWVEMTPAQYIQVDQQALEEQRVTGVCVPFEKEYYRKDGSCVSVLFGCAVFDQQQQKTIGFALDLTQRKQAEAALQQSEAKFRRLSEANLIGVAESHLDGEFFAANDAFLKIVSYTRDDLHAGRINWLKMTPPEYLEIDRQATEELRITGTFSPFEKEYYRKDGSRVPVLIAHAVFDQTQEIAIGFILDLTDRKRAEAASVLEERNRMAREIHDTLAQAFTSIVVHLDVAARKLESDVATTQKCIQTSYDLAQSGLAEARRSVAALRPHYLEGSNLYNALCLLASQMFAHNEVHLICNCTGEPYSVPPEIEHHLFRIGQEALMNAFKYAQATEIRLDLGYEPTQCVLCVRDNGIGFEPNRISVGRASNDGSGFGVLGMRERANRIGAQLTLQSAIGQGTEMLVVVQQEPANESI